MAYISDVIEVYIVNYQHLDHLVTFMFQSLFIIVQEKEVLCYAILNFYYGQVDLLPFDFLASPLPTRTYT